MKKNNALPSSFRDPSGFLFEKNKKLYRQINNSYGETYDLLKKSGLFDKLVSEGCLVNHTEKRTKPQGAFALIEPKKVPFISYPYEWSFSQLKDAALLTLRVQEISMYHGMTLKDASAYNIQFINSNPILIDTLSFEKYDPSKPWKAYYQFCKHFYAPLVLMAETDVRMNSLLRLFIDGIPLDLTSKLLPKTSWLKLSDLMHVHLHSTLSLKTSSKIDKQITFNEKKLKAIIESLAAHIEKLEVKKSQTIWTNYYETHSYSASSFADKKKIIRRWLNKKRFKIAWDLGGNDGEFSRVINKSCDTVISFDIDPFAIDFNYKIAKEKQLNILPLVMDFTNPSTELGWANSERMSLLTRAPADLGLALALVHHLSIGNNVPFDNIVEFFKNTARTLIVEWIPPQDAMVENMMNERGKENFTWYTLENFELAFGHTYKILHKEKIRGSKRILYYMEIK